MTAESCDMPSVEFVQKVSFDRIAVLICSALEGGIHYWGRVDWEKSTKPNNVFESEKWFGSFSHIKWPLGEGGRLCIFDKEEDKIAGYLDLNSIQNGLKKMAENSPLAFGRFMSEKSDFEEGDIFVQYCVFGSVIYG